MHRNEDLHEYLVDKTWQLTEDWYASLDKSDPKGVYSSTNPNVIRTIKQQNHDFHEHFCKIFIMDEDQFSHEFEQWILSIAQDEEHLSTPVHFILREFFNTQEQYLDLVGKFTGENEGKYTQEQINTWNRLIIKAFSKVMTWFTQENHKFSEARLKASQEMINELSSPVISLNNNAALLPLVGDIDTARAKFILEHTLLECNEKKVNHLFIDLSGVVMIDTMVAHQIFQLIETLTLIGVKSTLSGIRPEIAQTAVQLGISFDRISVTSTLERAINSLK